MRWYIWIPIALCACGEPLLRNVPKADPATVAGIAAAAATAATLADPQGAAARQEVKNQREPDNRGIEVKETVPADVLDRLDDQPQTADAQAPLPPDQGQPVPAPPQKPVKPAKPGPVQPVNLWPISPDLPPAQPN